MALDVIEGDCLAVLPTLATRFHAVVTDPPYHLGEVPIHKIGSSLPAPRNAERRASRSGFMGKQWDGGDVAFRPETWRAVFDVMLPGGWLIAMGGTRTYHRLVCAIEDAGFEVRDSLCWLYGAGFPKSQNASKALDRQLGAVREVVGSNPNAAGRTKNITGGNLCSSHADDRGAVDVLTSPATPEAQQWDGWGTALKPAVELICLARKPFAGNLAQNILRHGTGALNIAVSRVGSDGGTHKHDAPKHDSRGVFGNGLNGGGGKGREIDAGRYPANVITDGSPEVLDAFAAFGERQSTETNANGRDYSSAVESEGALFGHRKQGPLYADAGTAARFFYSSKADAADRADSRHPTVKPVDLIRYLVRLVTPPGGRVLDPFAGSGTTGEACMLLGYDCTLIERDATHAADIRHRIKRWSGLDAPLFADAAN